MRFAIAAVLFAACTARGSSPPSAPVDVTVADVGDAGAPVIGPPKQRPPNARCTARLTANKLEKAPTCRVDTKIEEGAGTLTWPCGGDGKAEAVFGEQRFTGSVRGGYLRLEIKTTPDWGDGCKWESRQLIEGYVREKQITWRYDETLLEETNANCYAPCDAKTTLDVDAED